MQSSYEKAIVFDNKLKIGVLAGYNLNQSVNYALMLSH